MQGGGRPVGAEQFSIGVSSESRASVSTRRGRATSPTTAWTDRMKILLQQGGHCHAILPCWRSAPMSEGTEDSNVEQGRAAFSSATGAHTSPLCALLWVQVLPSETPRCAPTSHSGRGCPAPGLNIGAAEDTQGSAPTNIPLVQMAATVSQCRV